MVSLLDAVVVDVVAVVVFRVIVFSPCMVSTMELLTLLRLLRALFAIVVETTGDNFSNSRIGNVFGFCNSSTVFVFVAVDVVDFAALDRPDILLEVPPAQRHVRELEFSLLFLLFRSADDGCAIDLVFVVDKWSGSFVLMPLPLPLPATKSILPLCTFSACFILSFRLLIACGCCCSDLI